MSSPRRSVDLDGLSEEHARAVESIVAALRVERIALEAVAEVRVELP